MAGVAEGREWHMSTKVTKWWLCTVCGYIHEGPEPPEECPQCGAGADMFEPEDGDAASESGDATVQARWVCTVCGYVHKGPEPPDECPECGAGADMFEKDESRDSADGSPKASAADTYLAEWARDTDAFETRFARIKALASGKPSEISPMRTRQTFPSREAVLFRGAQLHRLPLNEDEPVNTTTVIGRTAERPLTIAMPFYVSHMSFGALSREAKMALARGSRLAGTLICSGEGGLLPDERAEAALYIYELGTATFSHRDEAIRQADAVEIKIGQAAKPGLGGHLPKEKVTEEIAKVRGISVGEDSISPGRFSGIDKKGDLKKVVARVRSVLDGKPLGIKLTASHIEEDLAEVLEAEPDFITIDCRGGATGAAPTYIKDNVCLPPVFALHRARTFLDKTGSKATLCITGGFRDSADIAKALALGADAVALATASLIAIGCQQYRVCHTGKCPVGITTQDPELRKRLDIETSAQRLVNFYTTTCHEVANFARINGRSDVHDLDLSDLVTISNEISQNTRIEHV